MDKNHLVRLPIFSIHGNHDAPIGLDLLSSVDMLNTNSYVNYFGKINDIESVRVEPILFHKGMTKVALYGIGHIKDARLNLLFERNSIEFARPVGDDGCIDDSYFNILVVHQNRYKGMYTCNSRDSITDERLPEFVDLVIWGHEHESQPVLRQVNGGEFHILQPGSTVPTSLIDAESKTKHSFLLTIDGERLAYEPIPLKKQRPVIHR